MNGRFREDELRRGASELSMLCPAKRIAPHLREAEKSATRTLPKLLPASAERFQPVILRTASSDRVEPSAVVRPLTSRHLTTTVATRY